MIDPALIWFTAGIVLILLEFGAPGVVIGFFGIGAILTAITTWSDLTEEFVGQCLVFTISSLVLLGGLRRYAKKWFVGDSADGSADLESEFSGKEALALSDFAGGRGLVELKGAQWKARSDEAIQSGQVVVIDRREDLTLFVRTIS